MSMFCLQLHVFPLNIVKKYLKNKKHLKTTRQKKSFFLIMFLSLFFLTCVLKQSLEHCHDIWSCCEIAASPSIMTFCTKNEKSCGIIFHCSLFLGHLKLCRIIFKESYESTPSLKCIQCIPFSVIIYKVDCVWIAVQLCHSLRNVSDLCYNQLESEF